MTERNDRPDIASLRIDDDRKHRDRPGSRRWKLLVWPLLIIVAVAAFFWFKQRVAPATKVRVAKATSISAAESRASLVATGYVVAQRKAEVASKGTGRLVYLAFEEGDTVAAGGVIATLDNEDIRANLALAQAELEMAKADSLNAGRVFRRAQNLYETGSITETEFESAQTSYHLALAGVTGAMAGVKAAEVALENTFIRAPFDGTILTKNADVGEVVAPFASSSSSKGSVVTMADMTSLEVEADVSESNIHKVAVGQDCEIILDAYPETRYPGYVKKIVPTADRARATVLTKVAFAERDQRVLPEMSARVNFLFEEAAATSTEPARGVIIAKEAITTRDGQKAVFRVEGDRVTLVPVGVGRELGASVEIVSGLTDGDRVVLSPPGKMESGQKVEIRN